MSKIIINFTEQYQNGMTGFERFMEIMREDTEKEYKNPIELKNVKDNIEIDNVSFKYEDKKQILKNFSFCYIIKGRCGFIKNYYWWIF